MRKRKLFVSAVIVALAAVVATSLPDVARYRKIRDM